MKKLIFLCVCLLSCSTLCTNAQPSESLTSSTYAFRLTRLLLKNGTAKAGWFLGTKGDSVVMQVGEKFERFSRHDLLRIVIDMGPQKSQSALIGMLAGMYLGNALGMGAQNQPFRFLRVDYGTEEMLLFNTVFALVGGGIGYLVGTTAPNETIVDFAGSEEDNTARWTQFVEGSTTVGRKGSFHLSFQASWVSGPLPHVINPARDEWQAASSWNMIRRIQLTYSVSDIFDAGLAYLWLGQPSYSHFGTYPAYTNLVIDFKGSGFYAVGAIQPFWKAGMRKVQWDIGAGVGMASVQFRATSTSYDYPPTPSVPGADLQTTTFSALAYSALKVFLGDHVSIGVTADLVYIPEDVPAVKGVTFESTKLGTSSVGAVLEFHF